MCEHQREPPSPKSAGDTDRRWGDWYGQVHVRAWRSGLLSDATDVCLCLSALPVFLETNVVAILAVTIAGEPAVTDALTNLVRWTDQ